MLHGDRDNEVEMLGREIEILMAERERLLRVAGAAAAFIGHCGPDALPQESWESAEALAENLNDLGEDTLREAIDAVRGQVSEIQGATPDE